MFLSYDSDEDELVPTDTSDTKSYEVLITLQKKVHTTSGSYTKNSLFAFTTMDLVIPNYCHGSVETKSDDLPINSKKWSVTSLQIIPDPESS